MHFENYRRLVWIWWRYDVYLPSFPNQITLSRLSTPSTNTKSAFWINQFAQISKSQNEKYIAQSYSIFFNSLAIFHIQKQKFQHKFLSKLPNLKKVILDNCFKRCNFHSSVVKFTNRRIQSALSRLLTTFLQMRWFWNWSPVNEPYLKEMKKQKRWQTTSHWINKM